MLSYESYVVFRISGRYAWQGVEETLLTRLILLDMHIIEKLENHKDRASQCQYIGLAFKFFKCWTKIIHGTLTSIIDVPLVLHLLSY